jgi:hypothetical protein
MRVAGRFFERPRQDRLALATLGAHPMMKYGLLWFLGVPIPVLIVLYLLFH